MNDKVNFKSEFKSDCGMPENTGEVDAKKVRRRRKQTLGERDARFLKSLSDKNGSSRLDPFEPNLVGLHFGAVDTAISSMRWIWRNQRRPSPERVMSQVSAICSLTQAQEEMLREWLSWFNDRRWVLTEHGRSPVVEWAQSKPPKDDVWTEELAAIWRSKIDRKANAAQQGPKANEPYPSASARPDVRAAKAESLSRPAEPGMPSTATDSALTPDHPRQIGDRPGHSDSSVQISGSPTLSAASALGGEYVRSAKPEPAIVPAAASHPSSVHPPASPAMAVASSPSGVRRETFEGKAIIIPEFPTFFFKAGAHKANALLNAIKPNSFNEQNFRAAIDALLYHKTELNEFCERGPQQKKFMEGLFTEIGVKLP
jgi:hypothetical protein